MSWSRRLPSVVVLVGLLAVACNPSTSPDPSEVVTVFMESTGPGSLEATDPDDGTVVPCSGSATCGFDFQDVGGGGTITVAAVPDAGAALQSWTKGCPGSTAPTCDLSFSNTPATLRAAATFATVPPSARMFSDDFEGGCGQWSVAILGGSSSSSSEACPGSGGINGSAYRQMTHTFTAAGSLSREHSYTGGSLVVGDGGGTETCAATVRFQEQRRVTSPAFTGAAVGAWVWIKQDGVRFNGPSSTFSDLAWTGYNSGPLTAADFAPGLDLCPTTPSTLTFGFGRSNTNNPGGVAITNVHGIDDWSVTIEPAP